MANNNFVVQNGLTVGPLTIFAGNGDVVTSGNLTSVAASATFDSINNTPIGNATPSTGVFSNLTSTTNLTAYGYVTTGSVYAGTIGNTGATLTGTLSTASQPNITTLAGVTSIGASSSTTLTGTLQTAAQTNITSVGTLTGGTWNAATVATGYGGTGLTSFTSGGAVYATSSSALTTGTLPVASGGTGITSFGTGVATALGQNVTGSGGIVLATSPTLVTPALGTPSSATLTNATGLPVSTGISGLGTGVATALAVNTGSSGAFVVNGGALGTPSSGTVTNLTGTASININGTVGATTASTGAFTTLTASGVTTITNGTNATSTSSGALQVSGGASVLLDLWVGGNVYTNNVVSTTYTNLSVNDPLLYLSAVNPYPYNYDIGEYSHFVGGPANVYAHTGMVRSYANGYWGLFSNVKSEPAGTVNWNDAGLIWDTFKSGALLLANTTSASSTTSGALQVAGGAGIAGALYAGSAYDNGNRVVTTVNTTAGTGITLSAQTTTGPTTAVTITNSGVTSAVAGTDISISGATGAVTINDTSTLATVTGRGASTSTAVTFSGGITAGTSILPSSNVAVNIGSTSAWFNNIYGTAVHAQYADLAENYQGDRQYNPGTVLMFGGSQEVTVADADTTRVAGVVSTNPATLMNGGLVGPNVVPVAFTGRVPCNVIGPVAKGDLMVSAGFGYAKVNNTPQVGSIIGKALEDFPIAGKGVIEVVVGRF